MSPSPAGQDAAGRPLSITSRTRLRRLPGRSAVTESLVPGRWDAARPPTSKELAATAVLAVPLAEASVKVRTGPPKDDQEDLASGVWAGVVPAALAFGQPLADAALAP